MLVSSMKHVFDDSRKNRESDMIIGSEDEYLFTAENFLKKLSEIQNKGFHDSIIMVHPCIYNKILFKEPLKLSMNLNHSNCNLVPHYGMPKTKCEDSEEHCYISYILKKYCLTAKFNIKRCESFEKPIFNDPRFQIDISVILDMPGYEAKNIYNPNSVGGRVLPREEIPVTFIQSKI